MRRIRTGLLVAAGATALVTPVFPVPPRDQAPPQVPVEVTLDGQRFASGLRTYLDKIVEVYYRPVTHAQLVRVALAGLYDAARQPVPPDLGEATEKAFQSGRLDELMSDTYASLAAHEAVRGRDKALFVALQALPAALDQYSGLIGQQAFRQLDFPYGIRSAGVIFAGMTLGNDRPRFDGTDTSPAVPPGPLRVQQVIPGGPGQVAGLRPDDLIVRVNGKASDDRGFAEEAEVLLPVARDEQQGRPTATRDERPRRSISATVDVVRPGHGEARGVKLLLKPFQPESVFGHQRRADGSWDYLIDPAGKIGYVRIGPIWDITHAEFCQAMDRLTSLEVRGLILDLRWCPGGMLKQSASIARQLLPPDSVVYAQPDAGGRPFAVPLDTPDVRRFTDFETVVLVNGETSGGGELIAAALQDHRRAAVAGQRTVGKATIQQVLNGVDYSFKVSYNVFLRPSRRNLQRFPDSRSQDDWGVLPDAGCEIAASAELDQRLKLAWTLHSLRPAGSRSGLAADDPETDPVRQAALRILRERVAKPKS